MCVCTHAKSLQLCLTLLGDLLNPGIEPVSVMNPALAGGLFTTSATCMGIFNWSFVDLQSCVNFSYMCTHTHTLFHIYTYTYMGLPCGSVVTHWPGTQETWIPSLDREDPWRRAWQPTPVFLPGKSHGQKSLADYGPSGSKKSDMTEASEHEHTYLPIFRFFSIINYHKILNTIPRDIW